MKKQHVQLSPTDRAYLETLTRQGEQSARMYRRALAVLELDRGKTYTEVSNTLHVTIPTLSGWAARYLENGLEVLQDQPRSGRPIEIDGIQRAKLTALACSTPPEGYAQWSLRLLAEKAVELGYCEHISHTEVGQVLKKRTETASQTHLVYRNLGQSLSGAHGANSGALCPALRPALSRRLLR
jgi:putative transposase